jgi:4'-phosphopantetheinyl transferase
MIETIPPLSFALDSDEMVNIRRAGREYRLVYVSIPLLLGQCLTRTIGNAFQTSPPLAFKRRDFAEPFLNEDEMASLNGFKALKKQVEWMSGRYAAKRLAKRCLAAQPPLERTQVDYRKKGAPFFTEAPSLSLSISHAGEYAVAGIGLRPSLGLGLDLEVIRPESRTTLLQTAFSPREIKTLEHQDDEAFFRHWTAKEAYLKYIGLGFHESLKRVEILDGAIFHDGHPVPSLSVFSHHPFPGYAFSMVS